MSGLCLHIPACAAPTHRPTHLPVLLLVLLTPTHTCPLPQPAIWQHGWRWSTAPTRRGGWTCCRRRSTASAQMVGYAVHCWGYISMPGFSLPRWGWESCRSEDGAALCSHCASPMLLGASILLPVSLWLALPILLAGWSNVNRRAVRLMMCTHSQPATFPHAPRPCTALSAAVCRGRGQCCAAGGCHICRGNLPLCSGCALAQAPARCRAHDGLRGRSRRSAAGGAGGSGAGAAGAGRVAAQRGAAGGALLHWQQQQQLGRAMRSVQRGIMSRRTRGKS